MMPASHYEEQKLAKIRARAMKRVPPEEITVDSWLCGYRALFPDERNEQSKYDQQMMLMPFRRKYGDRKMWDISAIVAQDWALKHPSQVRHLRSAWQRAVVMRVAPFDVWSVVIMPPRQKEKRRAPTDAELEAIRTRLRRLSVPAVTGPWYGSLLRLVDVAAFTGARQSGLLALRNHDVDTDERRVTVTEKGGKTRQIIVPPEAWNPLIEQLRLRRRALRGATHNFYVWCSRSSLTKPMGAKELQVVWRQVRGDFPHGFHSLRHYCATWMEREGCDKLDIAVQLGHTDSEGRPYERLVERTYGHHVEDPEVALRRLQGRLG